MASPFRLHPFLRPQPEQLLALAQAARLSLRLPLPRQRIKLGMVEREWFSAHRLEVDVGIRAGMIDRASARTRIVPALSLPLGMGLRGLRLNSAGEFVLEFSRLGHVNLNRLLRLLPRIPEDPVDLWRALEGRLPSGAGRSTRSESVGRGRRPSAPSSGASGEAMEMQLQDLTPFPRARIELGRAGHIILGERTRVRLGIRGPRTEVQAHVHVEHGRLAGPDLDLSDVSGQAELSWSRPDDAFEIRELQLRVGAFSLDAEVAIRMVRASLEIPRFAHRAEGWTGRFGLSGQVAASQTSRWSLAEGAAELRGALAWDRDGGVSVHEVRLKAGGTSRSGTSDPVPE
jgi:hypothetical protein